MPAKSEHKVMKHGTSGARAKTHSRLLSFSSLNSEELGDRHAGSVTSETETEPTEDLKT